MKLVCSDIFEKFVCIGSECKDNCCRMGWDIEIDDDTYNFYKSLDDEIGKRLVENIYDEGSYHFMKQDGGCPFLNENGLCSVLLKYGEDRISEICAEHPRFYEWFGNYKEAGVGICCEEVCRLMVRHKTPLEFHEKETDEPCDELEFDERMFSSALTLRNRMIDFLQNRKYDIFRKLNSLICLAGEIQSAFDDEDRDLLDEISSLDDEQLIKIAFENNCDEKEIYRGIIGYFSKIDYFNGNFLEMLGYAEENLDEIIENKDRYNKEYSSDNYIYENLAVYFIFRYFLKSSRDYDGGSRIMFTAVSVVLIRLISMSFVHKNGKITEDDYIEIMKEFSKEIEYSAENMENLREDFYTDSRFSVEKLSGLLLKISGKVI